MFAPHHQQGIDVFLAGGGGNGKTGTTYWAGSSGGGGYTATFKKVILNNNYSYSIVIGGANGKTSGFGHEAAGGKQGGDAVSGGTTYGGDGGSGGTPAFHTRGNGSCMNLMGGTDGGNAGSCSYSHTEVGGTVYGVGGRGQGTTTREFGEPSGKLYSSGGNAYAHSSPTIANSGNGGSGSSVMDDRGQVKVKATAGSSGIIVIRNARN